MRSGRKDKKSAARRVNNWRNPGLKSGRGGKRNQNHVHQTKKEKIVLLLLMLFSSK